jgi:glycosyltransferase involved in cell wall biosynthesis
MIKDAPTISVIIPTHNRSASLKRTLDALSSQSYPLHRMEVVVVADGCSDGTTEMLNRYEAPFGLQVIEQSNQGPAAARNLGAASAKGALLLFLDDDIEAASHLVESHVNTHQQRSQQVVIGYLPTILESQTGFFRNQLRNWWEDIFHPMRQASHRYVYSDLLSGNFSLPASLFTQVGGFDPVFRCHEDYEFGVRLLKAGGLFCFNSRALGYHHEISTINRSLQRKYQEGVADIQLGRKHPDLIATLRLSHINSGYMEYPYSIHCLFYRILLILIFHLPAVGDFLAAGLQRLLGLLEWIRIRSYWRCNLNWLLAYWYLRGVADELGTRQALNIFLRPRPTCTNEKPAEIEINLRNGLSTAEQLLDEHRPEIARIFYGKQLVGHIPLTPGAELLRGSHLRHILATTLSVPLLNALASEGAVDSQPSLANTKWRA